MTSQEESLLRIAEVLATAEVPYMVIGGLANAVWGEPRATLDIDVTVLVPDQRIPEVAQTLGRSFDLLVQHPIEFVRQTRVLPLRSREGVRLDVIFGLLPFEEEAVRRAVEVEVAGSSVRFCTAEDLILMKVISDRERDLEDARGVLKRRAAQLDFAYLDPRVIELSQVTERPDIQARWRRWKEALTDLD